MLSVQLPIFCHDIIQTIAVYSLGKIMKCSNAVCGEEILILNKHKTANQNFYHDKERNIKYYYNIISDTLACNKCQKYVVKCKGAVSRQQWNWYILCDGSTMQQSSNKCGCGMESICVKEIDNHLKCKNCATYICGSWVDFISYRGDYCCLRYCSFCYKHGCQKCVPMIKYDCFGKMHPPRIERPIFKCKQQCYTILICTIL